MVPDLKTRHSLINRLRRPDDQEGWQDFLKNIRNRKPVYLELTEDEKETTAVVRQRAALFLEMPTAQ